MADPTTQRSHDQLSPRSRTRERDIEYPHARDARPVPDFEEVASDDELGSDENDILQRGPFSGQEDE